MAQATTHSVLGFSGRQQQQEGTLIPNNVMENCRTCSLNYAVNMPPDNPLKCFCLNLMATTSSLPFIHV